MSTVQTGGFANLAMQRRMGARRPINPLDKCTIVSVYPDPIKVTYETIFPGTFEIPKLENDDDFNLLVVGSSSWWKELGEDEPFLEIPVSSLEIADGFVRDFARGIDNCNMNDKMPGLFFIPGEYNKITIMKAEVNGVMFPELLKKARLAQRNWYVDMVAQADTLWARTNGNPLTISRIAKIAAEKLGMERPWKGDFKAVELKNCPACGELINFQFPVCRHCKAIIDPQKAKAMDLKFAV